MKISEVTAIDLMEHAREYNTTDEEVGRTFDNILAGCKAFLRSYTGLTDDQMDTHEDLTIALMVLAVDMYDNRTMVVDKATLNPTARIIMGMHSINLL